MIIICNIDLHFEDGCLKSFFKKMAFTYIDIPSSHWSRDTRFPQKNMSYYLWIERFRETKMQFSFKKCFLQCPSGIEYLIYY